MMFFDQKLTDERRASIRKSLGTQTSSDPAWPLPNQTPSTESDFWRWQTTYGSYLVPMHLGYRELQDHNGRKRWAAIIIYSVDIHQLIGGGFAVAIYNTERRPKAVSDPVDYEYVHDVEYFQWIDCLHSFTQRNIGRCLNQYTCVHCNRTYEIDSSD